jgi:hypothetical protein
MPMLISKRYRFIFIHIYKNAGTSITTALLPFAVDGWQRKLNRILKRLGVTSFDPQPFPNHARASELISALGKETFDSYFSFAVVRNPWDWQVSLYNYMLKNEQHHQHDLARSFHNFEEYLEWRCTEEVRYQKDFVFSEEDEQIVDFIGRYENLTQDFQYICSRIGISTNLPRLNVSNTKPYQTYYNERTIELVRQTFEPDIHLFDYEFQ